MQSKSMRKHSKFGFRGNHPYHVVNHMRQVGYTTADVLSAFPGKDEAYVEQLLLDTARITDRTVISHGILGLKPCESRYFNITEPGFRSRGMAQPWPPSKKKINIFFFGGSATLGAMLEDDQTIPAMLQCYLAKSGVECEVYNFGCTSYASRHEALRFLELLDNDFIPDYALFLDGNNDGVYALGTPNMVTFFDAAFQLEKRRQRRSWYGNIIESFSNRKLSLPNSASHRVLEEHPELECLTSEEALNQALKLSHRQLNINEMGPIHEKVANIVWNRYLDSIAIIRSLAKRRKVQTLFIWQPVSLFMTSPNQRVLERLIHTYRYHGLVPAVYNWLHAHNFYSMEEDEDFFDISKIGSSLEGVLYSDPGHYTSMFASVIAENISRRLVSTVMK